jgi:hypothetical protein
MVKSVLAPMYIYAGRKAEGLRILEELKDASKRRFVSPMFFAGIYWALGDKNQAFRYFNEAYEGRSIFLTQLRDPGWDRVRSDPDFRSLEKKIGLYQ